MKQIFPRTVVDTHRHGTVNWGVATYGIIKTIPTVTRRQGHAASKKVRVVCKICNNGWVSQLDNESKPILEKLVRGKTFILEPAEQTVLAAWIGKITMVADFLHREKVSIPQEHRTYLMEHREVPLSWDIWIGANQSRKWQMMFFHHIGNLGKFNPEHVGSHNAQSTTLGIGGLFAQVMSCSASGYPGFELKNERDSAMRRICHGTGEPIQWPPSRLIGDDLADYIAGNFARHLGLPSPLADSANNKIIFTGKT